MDRKDPREIPARSRFRFICTRISPTLIIFYIATNSRNYLSSPAGRPPLQATRVVKLLAQTETASGITSAFPASPPPPFLFAFFPQPEGWTKEFRVGYIKSGSWPAARFYRPPVPSLLVYTEILGQIMTCSVVYPGGLARR